MLGPWVVDKVGITPANPLYSSITDTLACGLEFNYDIIENGGPSMQGFD